MYKNLKASSLSRKLVILIILFSSLITLILTIIQFTLEYHHDTSAIQERLQQVKVSYQRGIENAIWDLDKKQVQVQIDGINELPDIEYAEITSDEGLYFSSGSKTQDQRTLARQYKLSHTHKGTEYQLGELTVIANLEATYRYLFSRFGIILLSNAIKTFLVALFITFLLKRTVIRHLQDVSAYISQMSSGDYEHSFKLRRKKNVEAKTDDLDKLSSAINKLCFNSKQALSDADSAKEELQTNFEQLQQLNNVSAALEKVYDPDQRLQSGLDSILKLFDTDRVLLAFLAHPDASHFQIPLCATHPDYALPSAPGELITMMPAVSEAMKMALVVNSPLVFEPNHPFLLQEAVQKFSIHSMMIIALRPKHDMVWLFAVQQCSSDRLWTEKERKLFSLIAEKLADPLGNYIYHKELIHSQERLAEAQSIAHIGNWESEIFTRKVTWSDEVFRIMGHDPQSFVPSNQTFEEIIHVQDRERVMNMLKEALSHPVTAEFRVITPDKSERTLLASAHVDKDQQQTPVRLFGVVQDITDQKEKERALQDSEQRLLEAQQISHLGHWEYNVETKASYWSEEFYRILGLEPYSFVPTKEDFYRFIHPDDLPQAQLEHWSNLSAPMHMEYRIIQPDGSERYISGIIRNSRKLVNGQKRIFGIIQDITERKQLEQKNRHQELQLIQADKMTSLGLMVSGVAHEINNPNNLIQINASLLIEMLQDTKPLLEKYQVENENYLIGGLPYADAIESMPDMVQGLSEASRRIERIIQDLKNFSRKVDITNPQEISVNDAVEASVRLLQPLILSKTYYLTLELADHLPLISGSLQHLEQILINLISNALDSLPDNKHKVWITTSLENDRIEIKVRDNGKGIPEENLKKIFDPFFTTKIESGGIGLGLSIAYNLTKEYKGRLSCDSSLEEGTTFTVSFPCLSN